MKTKLYLLSLVLLGLTLSASAQDADNEVNDVCGTVVHITATADEGYEFDHWSDITDPADPAYAENPREIIIDAAATVWEYVALFKPKTLQIIGKAVDEAGEELLPAICSVTGTGEGTMDTQMTITAVATDRCYRFKQWSDGDTNNPRTVTVAATDEANTYTAVFEATTFQLKVTSGDHGSVQVTTL